MTPNPFKETPALDLLIEFKKRCISSGLSSSGNRYVTLDREELNRYLDRELNQVIAAFVVEAVKPWQQAFTDAVMRTAGAVVVPAVEPDPPERKYVELWRGQSRGVWYRIMLRSYYRIELQRNTGMDATPEHECWAVEWAR